MTALLVPDLPGAACKDADPFLFFAPDGETVEARKARDRQARAICARCPACLSCLRWAVATGQEDGIWGGVDFGTWHAPLCRNNLHLMDAGNAWIDTHGSTKCRACRNIADQRDRAQRARDTEARNARDRARYAERNKQQEKEVAA
jgi:hypothetical protein